MDKKEAAGFIGYIKDAELQKFKKNIGKPGTTDFHFEPGNKNIMMRVKNKDVLDVKEGGNEKGEIKTQVLLKPKSHVETVVKMFRDIKAIEDPTISRLTATSEVSVSFV